MRSNSNPKNNRRQKNTDRIRKEGAQNRPELLKPLLKSDFQLIYSRGGEKNSQTFSRSHIPALSAAQFGEP